MSMRNNNKLRKKNSTQLIYLEKLMVLLRDGRTLIGYLRSVDQFANLVLHRTIERIHVGNEYGDIPRGVFIIRGENVVLLGEIVSRLQQTILQIHSKCLLFRIVKRSQNYL